VHRGKVVAHKVRRSLEVEPARHQTKVQLGILVGGQGMGRVESIVAVELFIDSKGGGFMHFCSTVWWQVSSSFCFLRKRSIIHHANLCLWSQP